MAIISGACVIFVETYNLDSNRLNSDFSATIFYLISVAWFSVLTSRGCCFPDNIERPTLRATSKLKRKGQLWPTGFRAAGFREREGPQQKYHTNADACWPRNEFRDQRPGMFRGRPYFYMIRLPGQASEGKEESTGGAPWPNG